MHPSGIRQQLFAHDGEEISGPRLRQGRQGNAKGRAPAWAALDVNRALMVLHDAVGDGESETRALAHGFGGEERIEYAGQ